MVVKTGKMQTPVNAEFGQHHGEVEADYNYRKSKKILIK